MNTWNTVRLSEVIELQRGHDLPVQARQPGDVPVLGSNGIVGFHDDAPYSGPGVTIGRSGVIGGATYTLGPYWPLNTCLFVKDFKGNDRRWVYYWLKSTDFSSMDSGSAQPSLNRNYIAGLPVLLPPVGEQKAISAVLGALDDKIAANATCIRILDEHLAAEYEHALREEPTVENLDNISEFLNRRRVPLSAKQRNERPGNVPYYGASGVFGYVDEALFDEPLVLVGEDGSVINSDGTPVSQYIWGPSWINNHAHALRGKAITTELLYYAIRRSQVAAIVTGAVQPKINMRNLKSLQIEIPSPKFRAELEATVEAEVSVKRSLVTENERLIISRDTLLPQLMTGIVRVKDAEALVESLV